MAKIARRRPPEIIIPPSRDPMNRPTTLEFEISVLQKIACSTSQPNWAMKTGAVCVLPKTAHPVQNEPSANAKVQKQSMRMFGCKS